MISNLKVCTKCCTELPISDFGKRSNLKSGLSNICKNCVSPKQYGPEIDQSSCKICTKCLHIKSFSNFTKKKGKPHSHCKDCVRLYMLLNFERDKKKSQEQKKTLEAKNKVREYLKSNREKINSYRRARKLNRTEEQKEKDRVYNRENRKRRATIDPLFKFKESLKTNLTRGLNRIKFSSKNRDILGCDPEELRLHFEKQFLSWMNWDNYGSCTTKEYQCSWHIDHIIPLSLAKNLEELKILSHWSNLQPLCSKENLWKKDKFYEVCNLELKLHIFQQTIIVYE